MKKKHSIYGLFFLAMTLGLLTTLHAFRKNPEVTVTPAPLVTPTPENIPTSNEVVVVPVVTEIASITTPVVTNAPKIRKIKFSVEPVYRDRK